MLRVRYPVIPAILVAALAALNWYCSSNTPVVDAEKIARERTTYAGLLDSARYVGMSTCAGCHPDVHATFQHTGMGLSFDAASRKKSSADFTGHPMVFDAYTNLGYHPYWQDSTLVFREFRMEKGETTYVRDEKVKYIVGSGQHTNSHIWESNGYLFQAPATFYTQKRKWDLPPGFEDGNNSRFNRIIGLECMTCHNGYPEFVAGSENKFTKVPNGIDCERCHGPGSIHVAEKSKGILIDTSRSIDYSIVNPSKLPIDLQFDVCQRCHIQGNAVLRPGKSFFDFRPGMRLSEVMDVYMPVYEGREHEHIMASHAERLKMSPCFKVTIARIEKDAAPGLKPYKNGLTCITCHNPHRSVKETGKEHFNASCRNCHTAAPQKLCSEKETIRLRKSNNCVGCHMPEQGTTDIPHVRVHDHRIAVHRTSKEYIKSVKRFVRIDCINNPRPEAASRAMAFVQYVEKFGMDKSLLDSALLGVDTVSAAGVRRNFRLLVHVAYLRNDFRGIGAYLKKVPDALSLVEQKSLDNYDAWTSYRVGEALQKTGNAGAAFDWFRQAYTLAPLYPEFANKYANALVASGKLSEAERLFRDITREHPEYAPGWSNHGYLLLSRDGNTRLAMQYIDKALQLDPDYEQALLNKAAVYLVQGNKQTAVRILHRVLDKNPSSAQAAAALQRMNATMR
jgi:hypothetical protein